MAIPIGFAVGAIGSVRAIRSVAAIGLGDAILFRLQAAESGLDGAHNAFLDHIRRQAVK
jgi:hypothetical protein